MAPTFRKDLLAQRLTARLEPALDLAVFVLVPVVVELAEAERK